MQFLKILFWCLLVFVAAIFSFGNWTTVPIQLWGGLEALVNLPLLLFVLFLAGFVPTLAYQHAVRWRLRSRLQQAERSVEQLRATLDTLSHRAAPVMASTTPDAPVMPAGAEISDSVALS